MKKKRKKVKEEGKRLLLVAECDLSILCSIVALSQSGTEGNLDRNEERGLFLVLFTMMEK